MTKKLVLVYPEVYDLARFREGRKEFPPFGPLYLAAVAEAAGYDVEIRAVDGRSVDPIDLSGADVVGYSISSSATYGVMLAARRRTLLREDALTLAGGVHANFYPERTLRDFDVRVVATGESEALLLDLLGRGASDEVLSDLPGVTFFNGEGRLVRNPARRPNRDALVALPLPARHLLPIDDVVMTDRLGGTDLRMAHVMFSRGCPYPCRFCAAGKTVLQYRSGASARAELQQLKADYGIEGFAIVDDNFIVNAKKVSEICDAIGDLDLEWSALSRVDTVNPELLAQLRAAGCIELKFGMESGSERILERMNKGGTVTPDAIRNAVRWSREAGIGVKLFVIHGFPGEDLASTRETIALLRELEPAVDRVSLFRFVPLPGTYVYDNPEEFSVHGTDRDSDWDGDWSDYHIHHNDRHWWGSEDDFAALSAAYREIRRFVDERWPDRHAEESLQEVVQQ